VDVSRIDTRVIFLAVSLSRLFCWPVAYHRLYHRDGEVATARGASAAGAGFVIRLLLRFDRRDCAQHAAPNLVPALCPADRALPRHGAARGGFRMQGRLPYVDTPCWATAMDSCLLGYQRIGVRALRGWTRNCVAGTQDAGQKYLRRAV